MDGLGDVLQVLRTAILDIEGEFSARMIQHCLGDADAAGFGERLEPSGNVDAIAVYVVVIDDDIAEIDANADVDALVLWDIGITLGKATLERDGALHCINDAREFDKYAVTSGFDDATVMLGDLRIEELAPVRLQALKRPAIVRHHKTARARDVRREDRSHPTSHLLPFHELLCTPVGPVHTIR